METAGENTHGYADQERYFLPADDQRVFGAGIKRRRVPFVPASTDDNDSTSQAKRSTTVGDKYLSIVMNNKNQEQESSKDNKTTTVCEVCGQPVREESHQTSISHQLYLEHSHPPSHLPRDHVGLKILKAQGWDPDSRLGLGASSDGIRVPISGKIKNDTVGLGVDAEHQNGSGKRFEVGTVDGVRRLNAKEVRLQEEEARRRAQKLQQNFYGKDLSMYLGPDG